MKMHRLLKPLYFLFFGLGLYFVYLFDHTQPSLPAKLGEPPKLYSTQAGDYLGDSLISALKQAKESIVLVTYTFKDQKIIQALNERARSGVAVKVIYDANASRGVEKKLDGRIQRIPRGAEGLMHLKLLVIDGTKSWLGSANMTRDSLRLHSNLIAQLDSPDFAMAILQKVNQISSNHYERPLNPSFFQIADQQIELRFLPDDQEAVNRLQALIRNAQKTIQVAMYTFTRQDLAQALIRAEKRGVDVEVIIDESSGRGASGQIVERLRENGVRVHLKNHHGVMHNKFMIVDNQILAHGSANWTKAAFKQNDDYIMILTNLTFEQKKALHAIWKNLSSDPP